MSTFINKKKAFPPRGFETTASPPPLAPNIQYLNGVPYTYQNGMAFFLPPQSQAAPIPAAPEAMFQGAGYHTQGPSPTYAAPMLYPVSNPAPMFLSPQHFAQFQQVPVTNQATQVMYAPAGLNTSLQTSNNGAEASSPLQIPSHAPPPFFLTQGEMRPELFYNMASGPQTYPFNAQMMMAVHESQFQYCDISTDQQPNSNASNEVMPQPIAEEHLAPQPPTEPSPTAAVAPENSEHPQRPRIDSETPIVSFRNLQKVDDGDCNRGARYNRNNSSRQGQNRSMHQNVAPKMVGQGDTNGNDRGTWPQRGRGRGSSIKSIPEFPYNNNNPNFVNNNNYKTANDTQGRGGYRGGSRGGNYRHNHNHNGRRVITRSSTPSPNDNSLPNPNALPHSNQFQVGQQQQFIQGRNMQLPYHAHHPGVATGGGNSMQHVHAHGYAHPHQPQQPQQQHHHQHQSSVPPRRVPNASNRRINHNNNSHQSSSRKRGDIDNGAAGDAPANLMTPPATPSITVTATDQEALCSGVKQINIQ